MLNRREFASVLVGGAATAATSGHADTNEKAVAAANISHLKGRTTFDVLPQDLVPGEVEFALYLPPGYDDEATHRLPLMILLHGGNGRAQDLLYFTHDIDLAMQAGRLPPFVIAMPSGRRSLYMDYRDGSQKWESLILNAFLPHIRANYKVSDQRADTYIGGISMGGLGSLRIAFKHPDVFAGIAAIEPAIEAALKWQDVGEDVIFWRPESVIQPMFGAPIDSDYWAENNPASIAQRAPDRLLNLRIYLEVGDQDMLHLYEGAEYLHRILFDAGIAHEYRLVHGADHVGPSVVPRVMDALGFIGRQIARPDWINDDVRAARAYFDTQKQAIGMDAEASDPRIIKGRRK